MTNSRTLKNMKKALFQAMAVATLAILPATAQAVPITGTLDLVGSVRVTATTIDWHPVGGTTGFALITGGSDYFAPLVGSVATELDLAGVPVGVQLNGGLGLPGFETFGGSPLPGLNFILDIIYSCEQASTNEAVECDAGLESPFRFDQDAFGTTVIINFAGRVVDAANPGEESTFTAKFDATFTGKTPAQILAIISTVGFIDSPYSAQKLVIDEVTEVPEPATLLTFGVGTALLGAHRRRRAKKSAQP
jgi:PEP-CTERM motif-containing protein